jgi:hypothetical protein
VVSALRSAAGELCDVVEQFGVFRTQPLSGAPPAPEETEGGAPGGGKERQSEKATKKKDKKKHRKEEEVGKKEEETGVKETPASSTGVEETPEAPALEAAGPEEIRRLKAEPRDENKAGETSRESRLQEEVDQCAEAHPVRFGLGSITPRGSAARHFRKHDEELSRRPAEPEGPPLRRDREGPAPRERSRSRQQKKKKKKSKGEAHRQRGRDYWRRGRQG